MMEIQNTFFPLVSIKTPLIYCGSKSKACRLLNHYIPNNVKEIVSPFLGGGSFELFLTSKNIKVYGYDSFWPLVNFWQQLQTRPNELLQKIKDFSNSSLTRDKLGRLIESEYYDIEDPLDQAAWFIIVMNTSYNGLGFQGKGFRKFFIQNRTLYRNNSYYKRKAEDRLIHYNKILNFNNNLLIVKHSSFEESLEQHPDLFAYCDPPYPHGRNMYGDSKEYHSNFDHERLASILHQRENWLLSYNNCELVKTLYPEKDFEYRYPIWNQPSRLVVKGSNEVLIFPKTNMSTTES